MKGKKGGREGMRVKSTGEGRGKRGRGREGRGREEEVEKENE